MSDQLWPAMAFLGHVCLDDPWRPCMPSQAIPALRTGMAPAAYSLGHVLQQEGVGLHVTGYVVGDPEAHLCSSVRLRRCVAGG